MSFPFVESVDKYKSTVKFVKVRGYDFVVCEDTVAMIDLHDIPDMGWIHITAIGQENVYFDFKDDAGEVHQGYFKP